MRQVWIRITEALHDGELLGLPQRHQGLQCRMQALLIGKLQYLIARDGNSGAQLCIERIGVRNHGVQAVVCTLQFNQHQQLGVRRGNINCG